MKIDPKRLRLYAVTDRAWTHDAEGLLRQVAAAVDGGAGIVQLREKHMGQADFLAEAERFVALCREKGAVSIINDNVEIAAQTGADRLLARLADSGISCCIATASEAFQARSAMERLGLWPHFRFAVSCVQYGGKTRPDIYLEAARRLGTAPAETVVFEDALHAARTAHEAGFRVCGVWDASAEEDQAALKALADWYVRDLGDWVP